MEGGGFAAAVAWWRREEVQTGEGLLKATPIHYQHHHCCKTQHKHGKAHFAV